MLIKGFINLYYLKKIKLFIINSLSNNKGINNNLSIIQDVFNKFIN